MVGEWGVLRANFCLDFYSLDRIGDLRLKVLSFKQKDNETLGKSWKRFSDLLESGPNLNLEDPILLFHFFEVFRKIINKCYIQCLVVLSFASLLMKLE